MGFLLLPVCAEHGTVIKIPESDLILPSVTIHGIVIILKDMGVKVVERDIAYGELNQAVKSNNLVVVCSVGTAGILARCQKLILVNEKGQIIATHHENANHPLYQKLGEARAYYWNIYQEKAKCPESMKLSVYNL